MNTQTRTKHVLTLAAATLISMASIATSQAALLTPTATSASSQINADRGPENTIDNPAFTLASLHPFGENNVAWQSANEIDGASIAYDLGGFFDLTEGHLWNYGQTGAFGNRGFRNVDVFVSSTDTADVNSAVFTLAVDDQMFSDQDANNPVAVESFALNASNVRWVRFEVDGGIGVGNFGGNRVGLFEAKFTGEAAAAATATAPEPSAAMLAVLGLMGVVGCARRRKRARA